MSPIAQGQNSAIIIIGGKVEKAIIIVGGRVTAIKGNDVSITSTFKVAKTTGIKVGDTVDIKKGKLVKKP
jgi:hypothetical protein